ncbi:hypothetical protein PF005_g2665, partial [Phytophthora fragariae]
MATKEAAALAMAVEEGKTRDLYNALRTGEHGVSLEALAQALYFLQHAEFTLFDVKDAFRSSAGASERFLAYREFQIALSKIARVKYYDNCDGYDEPGGSMAASAKQQPRPTDLELMCSLVDQLTSERHHHYLDTLRCQMTRCSALDTLEHNLPLLVQSFQLYGPQNCLSTNLATSMLSAITLDGFVDFLNAYFEYEEYFSFDDLARMSSQVLSGFKMASTKADSKDSMDSPCPADEKLNFAQFLELFYRLASAFHHKLLVREGAQLRRAVESCRLEFSLEQAIRRVHHARRQHYSGNVHGSIEIPPLALALDEAVTFFQFHCITPNRDDLTKPTRLLGWAHPALVALLRYHGTTLFVDGTFRCVPSGYAQCVVFMVHDRASGVYVPVFYALNTSRTADSYWDMIHFIVQATDQQIEPAEIVCDFEA